MEYAMAPMEGNTNYIYRNVHRQFYHSFDWYVTPFIVVRQTGSLKNREMQDVLPEHNQGIHVVPQLLTNKAEDFRTAAKLLRDIGYDEVNLNVGCPARTVVTKKRGAGLLQEPLLLRRLLDGIFEAPEVQVSIKTRIGTDSPDEFAELLELYNDYPISRLIVHPRVLSQQYRGKPDLAAFQQAADQSRHPLCYNGDLFTPEDVRGIQTKFPTVQAMMCGRGVLMHPWLLDRVLDPAYVPKKETLWAFHDALMEAYRPVISGERGMLMRMKEVWSYLGHSFSKPEKHLKLIRKAVSIADYRSAVGGLFAGCALLDGAMDSGCKLC